ncbi:MAG: response regulator [Candidatus Omnitrophica bacterium]|nr:response regulator [Candidatus Omnitrophota bacterium]
MLKILAIDDEPDFLKVLAKDLESRNYEMLTASTAKEGIKKAIESLPNLILMDILLPDMGGADAIKAIKAHPELSKTPVIFLTAIVKPEEGEHSMEINIDENWYLAIAKPYDKNYLISKIEEALA